MAAREVALSSLYMCQDWKANTKNTHGALGMNTSVTYEMFLGDIYNIMKPLCRPYTIYCTGYQAQNEDEKELIQNCNERLFGCESNTLYGDVIMFPISNADGMFKISLQGLYDVFNENGMAACIAGIQSMILNFTTDPRDKAPMDRIEDYNSVKKHLIIRPVNYQKHYESLQYAVYERKGDIALVLYLQIRDDFGMMATAKVPKAIYNLWKCPTAFSDALMNTFRQAPTRVYPDGKPDDNSEVGVFLKRGFGYKGMYSEDMPLVTTTKRKDGAIAMFYPGVQKKLAELLGGSYLAVFTVSDLCRVYAEDSCGAVNVLNTLKNINKTAFPADVLSDQLWRYDADNETFEVLPTQN